MVFLVRRDLELERLARSGLGIGGNIREIDVRNGGTFAELGVPPFFVRMLVLLGHKFGYRQRRRLIEVDYDGVGEEGVNTGVVEAA